MSDRDQKPILAPRLRAVWRRTQRKHTSAGLLAAFRWGVPLFLLGVAVDRLLDLPTPGRAVVLAVIVVVCIRKAWQHGWRHWRRFDPTRTALEVEKHQGGLDSLLVTGVQMARSEPAPGTSAALWEATREKAERAGGDIQPRQMVDFNALRVPAGVAVALAAVVLAIAVLKGPFLAAGLARIFNPWATVAYPVNTQLDLGPGDLVVKEGERAEIAIGVSGIVPDTADLFLRTGEGEPREIELEIADGRCIYTIASASRDFSYRVEAGDARSAWHQVRVITAPRIEKVAVRLGYPDYLEREPETVEALTLTVPQDTDLHWEITLDRAVREATLNRDGAEPVALEVTGDGRQLVIDEQVDASRGYSFSWVESEHGFDFESPRYYLQVASDQPPQVEITSPESNLDALLGRQLDLAVRARDDHGIGAATITYRVNLRPEKTVTLDTPPPADGTEHALGWDYREVLPDLVIGDTVSFVVGVADKYPDGPHTARSETRRITFLSREEYLAQIERKKDRLLSRVRSTYRQERAAHELVRKLDPADDSFLQTCQLEAIRQEMLRQQLNDTALEFQALLDDLAANNVTDAVEAETLERVLTGLRTIAEDQVATAASLLREQTGAAARGEADPTAAIHTVNQAARALAGLVLQRGIDYAREVLAREAHMLASEQATLRLLATRNAEGDLAARQEELATWTDELITSLQQGMRYDKRPISVLGLTRRLKELRTSGAEDKMRQAATLIRDGEPTAATALHADIITALGRAEFSMRTGAEYAAIMGFRSELDTLIAAQSDLNTRVADATAFDNTREELTAAQADLQAALVPALLPPVPKPRARLFDATLPQPPPVREKRTSAEAAITAALDALRAGEQQAATDQQTQATEQLATLANLLEQSSLEIGLRTQGLQSIVSTATERVAQIEDYEARQILLLEQTEETALDEEDARPLAEPQGFLAEEIADFAEELRGEGETDQDVLPLLGRLDQLGVAFAEATKALAENRAEDALDPQEQAADHLAAALELAQAQGERLTLLQDLYSFQRAVGTANDWMVDIVAEQGDLLAATKAATPESAPALVPVMNNLRQCLTDIAPVLDLVAGRLDAGTPLVFANTDLEDAAFAIEDEDFLDAADAQEVATESLAEVQKLVAAVQEQTGYVAEIVDFLHASQAGVALLAFRQQQLREQAETTNEETPPALVEAQNTLAAEASELGAQLVQATGMIIHNTPALQMREAHRLLADGDTTAAAEQMQLAEDTLTETAESLYIAITMLHGLPGIEVLSSSPPELARLLEVLGFASDQRNLSRRTEATNPAGLAALTGEQWQTERACGNALRLEPPHPLLLEAHRHLATAAVSLQSSYRDGARRSQQAADDALRHFVIEQAIVLETALGAASSSDDPVLTEAETDDLSVSVANFVSDFVSGEAPKDQKTEWEVLGTRNRAALNQNFARELPLEYRGTLKNYYERVAK